MGSSGSRRESQSMPARENISRSGIRRSRTSTSGRLWRYSSTTRVSWAVIWERTFVLDPIWSGAAFSAPPIAGRSAKRASVT